MEETPRAVLEAYGPYIRSCRRPREELKPVDVADLGYWSIWHSKDGAFTIQVKSENEGSGGGVEGVSEGPQDRSQIHVSAPAAVLLPPSGVRLHIPYGKDYWRCTFDTLHVPKNVDHNGVPKVEAIDATQQDALSLWGTPAPVVIPKGLTDRLSKDLYLIESLWWQGSLSYLRANHCLGLFLVDLLEYGKNPKANGFNEIEVMVSARLYQGLSVNDIAQLNGMSRQHLSRLVQQHRNMSPGEWLRKLRWELIDRLNEENLSEKHIANSAGYSSVKAYRRDLQRRK